MRQNFVIDTHKNKEVIDLTEEINRRLEKIKATDGIVHLQVMHTTSALTTADLDPGTDDDYLDAIDKMFPNGNWNHPHDPGHVGDHIMSSIIGPSVVLDVTDGKLELGTWQEVVLVELSGPRTRKISMTFISSQ